jgi:peptidyl-prolyl cis-trans isomerase B (cyclophilin B)
MSNSKRPSNPNLARRTSTPRTTQVVIAIILVVCIAVPVTIALSLGSDSGSDTSSQASSSKPSPTSVGDVVCDQPPSPQASAKTFDQAPDPALAENTTWVATVRTSCGDITMELDGAKAPQTVASFISLAKAGYFDDSPCHRLTTPPATIAVLQCGDPTGTGGGNPGYGFGIENAPTSGDYPPGTLAMARGSDPNTNGGQFFIVYGDTKLPTEGGGYSIFGKVTHGMVIVDSIAAQGVNGASGDGAPVQPISILSVSLEKQ